MTIFLSFIHSVLFETSKRVLCKSLFTVENMCEYGLNKMASLAVVDLVASFASSADDQADHHVDASSLIS